MKLIKDSLQKINKLHLFISKYYPRIIQMPTRNAKCRLFKKKKNPLQQCTPFQIQNIHQAREGRKSATAQKEFAAKQRASTGYVSPCNVGLPSLCRNKGAGWEERFLLQRISEKPALDVKEPFSGLSLRSIHPCSLVIHAKHSSPLVAPTILLSRINLRRKKRKSNEERERRGDSWTKRELAGPSTLLFRNRKLVCQNPIHPKLNEFRPIGGRQWRVLRSHGDHNMRAATSWKFPRRWTPFLPTPVSLSRSFLLSLYLSLSLLPPHPSSLTLYRSVLLHRYS